jgi:hypothetical protein
MYNENKVSEGEAKVLSTRNFDCEQVDFAEAIFRMTQQCRRSDNGGVMRIKQPVFSCSLNLNEVDLKAIGELRKEKGEEAEDDFYRKIADRYMLGMGYGEQPYMVYKHEDIERTHIHIVSIRVDQNRRKINDSYEHRRSERVRNEINEEFGLSIVGENNTLDERAADRRNSYIAKAREGVEEGAENGRLKSKISNILKFVDENYHPKNFGEYNKILSQFSIACKTIEAVDKNGNLVTGCQFGAVGEDGGIVSHLIAGSRMSEKFSFGRLQSKFMVNSHKSEDLRTNDSVSRKYVESQIKSILASPRRLEMGYVRDTLHARGIEMLFVGNKDGETVGLNFIDNLNGKVFSGSSIGRNYTYSNLCAAIERHNQKTVAGDFVDKQTYVRANKLLVSLYNSDRRQDHYFESDMIRSLAGRREAYCGKLMSDLHLTAGQAEKCFSSFHKFKSAQLSPIEHKEDSYIRSQMADTLRFCSMMSPDENRRKGIMMGMGVGVEEMDGKIVFRSIRKPGIWIDEREARESGIEARIVTSAGCEDVGKELSKGDKAMIRSIVAGEFSGEIPASSLHLIELLADGEEKKRLAQIAISHCPSAVKEFGRCADKVRNKQMRENGVLESAYVARLDDQRERITAMAMSEAGIGKCVADALFERYRQEAHEGIEAVHAKENAVIENRIRYSLRFAENISDPRQKTEFLKRMEISVRTQDGRNYFTYDRKPSHVVAESKVSNNNQQFEEMKNYVKPFAKKVRDFVRDFVDGKPTAEDYPSVTRYLDSNKNRDYAGVIYRKAMRTLESTHIGKPSDVLHALICRGIIVIPVDGKYKVGKYDMSTSVMQYLPDDVARIIDRTDYKDRYKEYLQGYLHEGKPNDKLNALISISFSADHNSKSGLEYPLHIVGRMSGKLGEVMRDMVVPDKSGKIDYTRILKLVDGYKKGETIKIPPRTQEPQEASLLEQERDVVLQNIKKYGVKYVADLIRYGEDYMVEHQDEAEKIYGNNKKIK